MSLKCRHAMIVVGLFLTVPACRADAPMLSLPGEFSVTNPGPYTVLIEAVMDGSPAQKAGIRPGDQVIALDGVRVRTTREYIHYIRKVSTRPQVQATIRRGSEHLTLTVGVLPDTRTTGCAIRDHGPSLWKMLYEIWAITPVMVLELPAKTKDAEPDLTTDLVAAFTDYSPPPVNPLTRRMASFPARAQEALWRGGATRTEARTKWVIGLLKTYGALTTERYADATNLISRSGLLRGMGEPFLDGLPGFYGRLAKNPPSAQQGLPFEKYGVDAAYFSECYPYPVMAERRTDWFSFDPDFARVFDLATSGDTASLDELHENGLRYCNKYCCQSVNDYCSGEPDKARYDTAAASDPGFQTALNNYYIGCVQAAIIEPGRYGGWPFRHPALYDATSRTVLLAALKEQLTKHPEKQVLTAFALLAPSLVVDDVDAFSKSYQLLFDAGTRELATANQIIDLTLKSWHLGRPRQLAVQRSVNKNVPVPEVYTVLCRLSPEIQKRAHEGCYYRDDLTVQDLGDFCLENPNLVARAIVDAIAASPPSADPQAKSP